MDGDTLVEVLQHEQLCVSSEEAVLAALMRWVQADQQRVAVLPSLLQHVRWPFMRRATLTELHASHKMPLEDMQHQRDFATLLIVSLVV